MKIKESLHNILSSPKTSAAGIVGIICWLGSIAEAVQSVSTSVSGVVALNPKMGGIAVGLFAISKLADSLGLLFSRDNNVTSEQIGLMKK